MKRPSPGRWEKATGSWTYSRCFKASRPLRVSSPPPASVVDSARRCRTPERTFWRTSATRRSSGGGTGVGSGMDVSMMLRSFPREVEEHPEVARIVALGIDARGHQAGGGLQGEAV